MLSRRRHRAGLAHRHRGSAARLCAHPDAGSRRHGQRPWQHARRDDLSRSPTPPSPTPATAATSVAVGAQATIVFLSPARRSAKRWSPKRSGADPCRGGAGSTLSAVRTDTKAGHRRIPGRFAGDWRRDRRSARGERMTDAFICDAVRTPIGRYGGALSVGPPRRSRRHPAARAEGTQSRGRLVGSSTTSSSAAPIRRARIIAMSRGWRRCSPGSARRAPGTTVNRLCGSGLDAVAMAARAIKAGEADLIIAGGVESMTRAPFVMPKADSAFGRDANAVYDTTIGWRFVNKSAEGRVRRSIPCPRPPRTWPRNFRSAARTRTGSPSESQGRAAARPGQRPARRRDRPGRPSPSARAIRSSSIATSIRA